MTDLDLGALATDWESVGMPTLAAYPDLMARATVLAERHAERVRREVGDIAADAVTAALSDLAAYVGRHGMPTIEDDRAVWLAGTVKRAVYRERDRARARWAPRRREMAPTDAPNKIENWAADKLITHAERFTNGSLTTAAQARAVIDGRAESPTVAPPRRMILTRQGGSTFVYGVPRTAAPSAESDYFRGTWDAMLSALVDGSPLLLAAADAYRGERRRVRRGDSTIPVGTVTRGRYVAWAAAARTVAAADRGTYRRRTVAALKRGMAAVAALAAVPRAMLRPSVPPTVAAPTVPTALHATLPVSTVTARGPLMLPTGPYWPRGAALTGDAARQIGRSLLAADGAYLAWAAARGLPKLTAATVAEHDAAYGAYLAATADATAAHLDTWLAERETAAAESGYVPTVPTAHVPSHPGTCDSCHAADGGAAAHAPTCPRVAHVAALDAAAHRAALADTWSMARAHVASHHDGHYATCDACHGAHVA